MEFDAMLKKFSRLDESSVDSTRESGASSQTDPPKKLIANKAVPPELKPVSMPDEVQESRIQPGNDVHIRVRKALRVPLSEIPAAVVQDVARRLTFVNPLWLQAKRSGRLKPEITQHLTCYWIRDGSLNMTRGFAGEFMRILQAHHLQGVYEDFTVRPDPVQLRFNGVLYAYERETVDAVRKKRFGIIQGSTGAGKKVVSFHLAALRRLPVLVIVHTRPQLYQWRDTAIRFLDLPQDQIGIIGDGRLESGRPVTIATNRTLPRILDDIAESVGFLVVDQCDSVHLNTFFKLVRHIPSAYMLGLAVSRKRRDKLSKLMCAYMGPVLHTIDAGRVFLESTMVRPELNTRDTPFDYDYKDDWKAMVGALSIDPERNDMIARDVLAVTAMNREARAAVMVERLVHLEAFNRIFAASHRECAILSGQSKKSDIPGIIKAVDKGKPQIVCATSKSFPLLDLKRITHLFIASPVRNPENLSQAVGKLFWAKAGDTPPKIFDYRDRPVQLRGSHRGRLRVYREMGVRING